MVGIWIADTVQRVLPSKLQIITGQGCGHAFWLPFGKALATFTHKKKEAWNGVCCSPCPQDLAPSDSPRFLFPRRSGWGWVSCLCPFARWLPLLAGSWKATPWREVHTRLFCWQTLLKGCWCDMLLVSPHWHPPTRQPAGWLLSPTFFLTGWLFLSLAVLKAFLVS